MQKYIDAFTIKSNNINIITLKEDIQKYFNKCDLMITDYSSVAFDFAYLRKPIIYYQFDKEKFRKLQYAEGYFDYETMGFGDVIVNDAERENSFFIYHDKNNCKRVYEAIK